MEKEKEKPVMPYGRYHRPKRTYAKQNAIGKVDFVGYVPTNIRIAEMLRQGKQNEALKAELYDSYYKDMEIDILRQPGVDLIDIHNARLKLMAKYQAVQLEAQQQQEKQRHEKLKSEIMAEIEKEKQKISGGNITPPQK